MKKLKLRKWVKVVIAIVLLVIISIVLTHFILSSINIFNESAMQCDQTKGSICSYYEVQKFIKTGVYNG